MKLFLKRVIRRIGVELLWCACYVIAYNKCKTDTEKAKAMTDYLVERRRIISLMAKYYETGGDHV